MKRTLVRALLAVVLLLSPAPSLHRTSTASLGSNDHNDTMIQTTSNAVHVTRTTETSWDMMDLTFDRVHEGVQITGMYRSSKGGELTYRAQMTRSEGYIEISNVQERFTVCFVRGGCERRRVYPTRLGRLRR